MFVIMENIMKLPVYNNCVHLGSICKQSDIFTSQLTGKVHFKTNTKEANISSNFNPTAQSYG